jgi:protein-L-isoaspartate(D-aspartate) O-methyltransferase
MFDFARARRMMVDGQVRTSDVTDLRLIAAMLDLPRERFVPAPMQSLAYLDCDLPVTEAAHQTPRCLLKPMVLAKLIQAAEVAAGDRVLDVGCATGYAAAILSCLAGAVVALEELDELATRARENLKAVGASNVEVVTGPLTVGWAARAPYDVIVLNGATDFAPEVLLRQLGEGGRLVCVLDRSPASKATLYRRTGGHVSAWPIFDATAPVLPGFLAAPAFVF